MEVQVNEMSKAEFDTVGSSRGKWDRTGIMAFAKELSSKYKSKVIGLPIESIETDGKKIDGFFNKYYKGGKKIKYINYYCRKHLLEAFESLEVTAEVRTTKNQILISLSN